MSKLAVGCIRSLLIFFNTIFLVGGLTLLGLSLYLFFGEPVVKDEELQYFIVFLIGFGVLVSIIALIGCCGVLFDSRICLAMYVLVLSVFFLVEVVGVVFGFVYQKHVLQFIEKKIAGIRKAKSEANSKHLIMRAVSHVFNLCSNTNRDICIKSDLCKDELSDSFLRNCRSELESSRVQRFYSIVVSSNIAIAAVSMVSIFASVSLWHSIRRKRR